MLAEFGQRLPRETQAFGLRWVHSVVQELSIIILSPGGNAASQFLLNATEPKENLQKINDISHESIHKTVFERLHLFLSAAWKGLTTPPNQNPLENLFHSAVC